MAAQVITELAPRVMVPLNGEAIPLTATRHVSNKNGSDDNSSRLDSNVALTEAAAVAAETPASDSPPSASIVSADSPPPATTSRLRMVVITLQLASINFINTVVSGLIVVGLPVITSDLALPRSLAFWPSSVVGLTGASTLLLAGAVADCIGPRNVELVGCFITGAVVTAAGAARNGGELVGLRAVQGVALSLHYAASISLITAVVPRGRLLNIAFSILGLSQPLGFSTGLVLGGVLVDTIGWRGGWYLSGGITILLASLGVLVLPRSDDQRTMKQTLQDLKTKVDWVGAALASIFMTCLSYLLAILSADVYRIKSAESISLLSVGVVAIPCFVAWMRFQERSNRPALIPNGLWKNSAFSSICGAILLSFAVLNSLELIASLFFQEIQGFSALQAAIRILPSLIVGMCLCFTTGLVVHRIPATLIILTSSLLVACGTILMAVIDTHTTYWGNAFVAQLLQPISGDCIFTVGLIVITEVFPKEKQALAGAVFNTAAQFGNSCGLAIMQVVSTLVTKAHDDLKPIDATMEGYRATFWTMFAMMITCGIMGSLGLRKSGKVGLKTD